ncbi:MAG: stress responsive protein [Pirellulaceae bacterium]|nr:MAG: stress responsive protein [Pirellulaceae bacterium]
MSKRLAHMVYFELEDSSAAKIQELMDECKKYLTGHPGQELFAVGTLNPDLARPVNDRAFHVALHTIFADRAAHDAYQTAPRHVEFIERNKANWKTVRVFDSDLEPAV